MTEALCRCLPRSRCGTHRKNVTQQIEIDHFYQKKVQACLAKEDERTYEFYWWSDFKTLPPDDRRDHPMLWDRGWEHIFDHLDLVAKEVLYCFMHFA